MKIIITAIIAFFLHGCNPFGDFKPTSPVLVKRGWARNPAKEDPEPLYCYRTLGDSVCHTEPIKTDQERFKGSYSTAAPAVEEEVTWLDDFTASLKKTYQEFKAPEKNDDN